MSQPQRCPVKLAAVTWELRAVIPPGTACSVITGLACSCLAPGSAEIQSEEGDVVIGERDGEAEEAEGGAEQGYGLSWGLTSARSQGKLRSVTLIPQC